MVLLNKGYVAFSSIGSAEENAFELAEYQQKYFSRSFEKVRGMDVLI